MFEGLNIAAIIAYISPHFLRQEEPKMTYATFKTNTLDSK